MVKPTILPEGQKKEAVKDDKGTAASLPAFAVIPLGSDLPPKSDDVSVEAAPIAVVNRPRKLGVCLCVTMLLTLLLIVGLAVAMFLGRASGKYQYWCGVGYGDNPEKYYQGGNEGNVLEEDIEVNPFEGYEQIEIPEQDYCERLTILHDFTVNLTAYRLRLSSVCYVTVLDKGIVMGPEEFIERAEENPEFLSDHYDTVQETYRAVLPEISSSEMHGGTLGYYIPLLCDSVESYWIEKIPADEMEAWQAYWDEDETEDDGDDDDDGVPALPNPEHRRRRAAEGASDVAVIREFAGRNVSKVKIFGKEAVKGFKAAVEGVKEAFKKN
ncbi:integral membrane protein 2C-like [Acanthaster planci]|uniref:Integral membrane protein 2 n=1 Tax=Acanthaster planci TaxID=133434 RepID=A0A8B7YLM2_ACAPL|nr:integral membrane protein 2C-like [Acanthaster planci]